MKILVTLPLNERHKEKLAQAAPEAELIYMGSKEVTDEVLESVSAVIGNIPAQRLCGRSNIRWVQLGSAGADKYVGEGILPAGTIPTNSSGAYSLAISEHMIGQLLMHIKHLDGYYDAQKEKRWTDCGAVRSIWDSHTLVVGLGDIGGEFARKMAALGSHVTGIRRHVGEKPAYLEGLYGLDRLDELLPEADYVALCLPGTGATRHLFDAARFGRMKRGAVLLNVGRGQAVDSYALNDALRSGQLSGACIDVVEPEPLPADHPLWDAPGLLLTPHVSGDFHLPETLERIVRIAAFNLRAFAAGETLKNRVDLSAGYRRNDEENKAPVEC